MSSKMNQSGDDRFSRVQKDPRFWEMPEKESKIKIDKRFQAMFHDKRFKLKYTMDKRGRPINHTSSEDMKRFYNVSDSEEEDDKSEKAVEKKKKKKKAKGKLEGEIEKNTNKEKDTLDKDLKITGKQLVRGVRVVVAGDDDEEEEEQQSLDKDDEDDGRGDSSEVETGEEEDVSDLGDSGDEDDDDDDDEVSEAGSHLDQGSLSGSESEEDTDSEPDLARGKGNVETSSDEDDGEDVDAILRQEEEEIEHDWGELCKDAQRNDQVTRRLAVCNMDWDRIKAKDLLALFSSFKPKGGVILSVKIYPSEFGRERIHLEKTQGPLELRALPDDPDEDNDEQKVYREKMRDYQFKRLKYYYAVLECDSLETASKIYEECDGFEYESSCSIIDLRFIPDDVMFDDEPKDVASEVDLSVYTPKLFSSAATSTSKVELTWDETDHERVTALQRKFNKDEILAMDFNAYLASSSEEEEEENGEEPSMDGDIAEGQKKGETAEEEEEDKPREDEAKKKKKTSEQITKYRELLKGIQEKETKQQEDRDMEMEITWVPGLKETTEQLVKKKLEGKDPLTPWEDYLSKKKQKKKEKKVKRKQGETDSDLSDDELPPDVDLNDPFFAEELGSSELKTRAKGKKNKKSEEEERTPEEEAELEKQKAEIALLMEDEDDDKHKHFNYDQIVKEQNLSKKKKKKLLKKKDKNVEEDDFQVDVKDPRFQAMFTSHLFSLDPCDPNYKKTKGTQSFLAEKQRRREKEALGGQQASPTQEVQNTGQEAELKKQEKATESTTAAEATKRKAMDPSLSLLVKSIKNKTEKFQAQKKQRIA